MTLRDFYRTNKKGFFGRTIQKDNYIIKKLDIRNYGDMMEFIITRNFKESFIANTYNYEYDNNYIYIKQEYYPLKLEEWLKEVSEDDKIENYGNFLKQMIRILLFMKNKGFSHNFLTPRNIRVNDDNQLVIINFNYSHFNIPTRKIFNHTTDYNDNNIDSMTNGKNDLVACGNIFYEMIFDKYGRIYDELEEYLPLIKSMIKGNKNLESLYKNELFKDYECPIEFDLNDGMITIEDLERYYDNENFINWVLNDNKILNMESIRYLLSNKLNI